jgi:(E)-4-hydroxy-3-methylbut-2-enyl-diphosphate synthase
MEECMRKKTETVKVGDIEIGGAAPVSVQSMTNTDTKDINSTVNQINALKEAGCDIVRLAVTDMDAAKSFGDIKKIVDVPLVADIHFDYRLALECIKAGADKIRINPGNIGNQDRVKKVVKAAKDKGIPIRIGVNSGSVEKELLDAHGGPTPQAMVESALRHVKILKACDFEDIVISIKASDVISTITAYRLISERVNYPLHLGITEAGSVWTGTIKSAIGIGTLLADGIGDTIRVSLTGDPVEEVKVAKQILKSLGLRKSGIEIISCPTCGRCRIDLIELVNSLEKKLSNSKKNIKVAVMGCAVNGPGEAKEADIGIAGGDGVGLIFKKGLIVRKVPEKHLEEALLREIELI